ncbi:Hypothetical predicted protein [Lecanosticta acicola]|uniref:DUF7514 domain-containing protein n=1 Tax=Lecanosticta acicola TaxID=111012 RepID=A0AAI8Z3K3_9PEZI|nr:Hypothetical predicted protein [Lecanosticta acicola]
MADAAPVHTPPPEGAVEEEREEGANEHETESEQREAYEYWGYLFKPDKTGTDKLKSLLRGLKNLMNERYEHSDNPDLTPNQLAHFYRDLHGNYDQLFLGTPSESIAFIYKSLGCLHSLQPPAYTHATAFTDPTVPALKTEGWIMWQTIQLLLGPEEHSDFIREAVQKWDIKDADTGEIFPKILPRECFPHDSDKHMVAWYEGVSERLRREAEEEERRHQIEVEHEEPPRRLHAPERPPRREGDPPTDDEGSVDSRGPALAYFRNPLYRHVDGRPSIVRRNSKRPAVSPRQTMMGKGKEAASTFGRIARNVGSPHLWGGRVSSRSRDRDAKRRSHPEGYHHPEEIPPTSAGSYENRYSPREHSGHGHHHRRSSQLERPPERPISGVVDEDFDAEDEDPVYSPQPRHPTGSDSSKHRRNHSRPESRDQGLRHSKSHEPTPSQKEADDYFSSGYDEPPPGRRHSTHERPQSPSPAAPAGNGIGPSFGPSAGPLFAAHVAKQPPSMARPPSRPPPEDYTGGPPMRNPSIRRAQERYPSRSPESGSRPPPHMDPRDRRDPRDPRDRRFDSPGRPPPGSRYNNSPAPYDDIPPGPEGMPPGAPGGGRYAEGGAPPPRDPREMSHSRDPRDRDPRDRNPRDYRDPRDMRDPRDRRGGRMNDDDLDYPEDDGHRSRPKQTRFADTGVSGRRYPDESPWRDERGDRRRRS